MLWPTHSPPVFPVSPCQDSPLGSLAKLKEPAALLEQPDPPKGLGGSPWARARTQPWGRGSTSQQCWHHAGRRLCVLGVGSAVAPWRWDWNPCKKHRRVENSGVGCGERSQQHSTPGCSIGHSWDVAGSTWLGGGQPWLGLSVASLGWKNENIGRMYILIKKKSKISRSDEKRQGLGAHSAAQQLREWEKGDWGCSLQHVGSPQHLVVPGWGRGAGGWLP